jgi:hypothetical protein
MGALSILFLAAGAVLTFAIDDSADGVNLDTVGIILMIVGGLGLIVSAMRGSWLGFSSVRERHVSDDGRTVVDRERTSGF